MNKVIIRATYKGSGISRVALSQQAFIIMDRLARDGATDIACNFKDLDSLPIGAMIL